MSKPTGEIRICTEFWDINKGFPKDNFSLPNIDMLIDNTVEYEMLSFMDIFFRYNQICITPEDQHNINFTTPWGTFSYKVMPFCFENIGATY